MGKSVWDLISEADSCNCDCRYDRALKLIDRAISFDPGIAFAHYIRGMTMLGLKRHQEAVAAFTHAIELEPQKSASTLAWRARTFADMGEHRSAAEDWLRLVREFPDGQHAGMGVCPLDWSNGAEQLALAGDPRRAIELLEEYLSRHAVRVTQYACYETAPLRLLARLLEQAGEVGRAAALRAQARASAHRVPADG